MFRMNAVKGGEEDISSPNDWPTIFPQLKDVDNLLRCGICYDFLKTSMAIKTCSHTFCSLCIRQYFSYQNKCPTCYTNAVESDLQNNRLLDEIIQKFISVRSALIQHLQNSKETKSMFSKQESNLIGSKVTPPDKGKRMSLRNRLKDEKQKTEESNINCSADLNMDNNRNNSLVKGESEISERRLTRGSQQVSLSLSKTSAKADKKKEVESTPIKVKDGNVMGKDAMEEDSVLISSDDSDDEEKIPETVSSYQPVNSLSVVENFIEREKCATSPVHIDELGGTIKPVVIPSDTDSIISLHDQSDVGSNASVVIQSKGDNNMTAPCPVCGVEIRTQVINLHLDSCLAGTEKKSSLRRSVLPKRKPLAKLVYNLLSEKELRKKLKEIGLSIKGDKKVLIKRHHDYVLRYNADCDSLNPKSVEEIIKEVEKNERAKTTNAPFVSKKLVVEKGSSPRTVRKAQEKYEKAHEKQFTDLIKATRQRMKSKSANLKRQTRSSVSDKSETGTDITSEKYEHTKDMLISPAKSKGSKMTTSSSELIISESDLSDNDASKPKTRKSLRLRKSNVSDVDGITESQSKRKQKEERNVTKHIDGKKFEQKENEPQEMDIVQQLKEDKNKDDEDQDEILGTENLDCSKCIDKKQPVSPCRIHKNKVHIQVEVHNSPKCTRHLLFKEGGNKSEDDLKSSSDTDENKGIRASRRTRSSISKTKSDHVTNLNINESNSNILISTEKKKNDKDKTHDVLKTHVLERSKEASCSPRKCKQVCETAEKVADSSERSPNRKSTGKLNAVLTKNNKDEEKELTSVQKSSEPDIKVDKHSNKHSPRKSASGFTNSRNEKEKDFTLVKDRNSPKKSSADFNKEKINSDKKFSIQEMERESVVRHSCNLDKILTDSPSKSPFKDRYMYSFSPMRVEGHSNSSVFMSENQFQDLNPITCIEGSPTKTSSKMIVSSPKMNTVVKSPLKTSIMSPGTTSPQKISSKTAILSPGTNSPAKSTFSETSFISHTLSPGAKSPSKKSFRAQDQSPGANSPSKNIFKANRTNSPSGTSFKAHFLSPEANSPSKTSAKVHNLSPGINSPKTKTNLSPGTKSPFKPHTILSPRRAGLSCSPLRQHKLVKTGDITCSIVEDSESETDFNDSLISKIAKAIDKFESDEDDVQFADFKRTWPELSSQNSTRSEDCDKFDDSTLESDTESNNSFGSDISNIVPETAPIKLQKNDYFPGRRSHSKSKCKEDKCAKLKNKRKYATSGGNRESKRRRIN